MVCAFQQVLFGCRQTRVGIVAVSWHAGQVCLLIQYRSRPHRVGRRVVVLESGAGVSEGCFSSLRVCFSVSWAICGSCLIQGALLGVRGAQTPLACSPCHVAPQACCHP